MILHSGAIAKSEATEKAHQILFKKSETKPKPGISDAKTNPSHKHHGLPHPKENSRILKKQKLSEENQPDEKPKVKLSERAQKYLERRDMLSGNKVGIFIWFPSEEAANTFYFDQ